MLLVWADRTLRQRTAALISATQDIHWRVTRGTGDYTGPSGRSWQPNSQPTIAGHEDGGAESHWTKLAEQLHRLHTSLADAVLHHHPAVFEEGLGTLKAKIHEDTSATPHFCRPRLVPYAMWGLVEKELERLGCIKESWSQCSMQSGPHQLFLC